MTERLTSAETIGTDPGFEGYIIRYRDLMEHHQPIGENSIKMQSFTILLIALLSQPIGELILIEIFYHISHAHQCFPIA